MSDISSKNAPQDNKWGIVDFIQACEDYSGDEKRSVVFDAQGITSYHTRGERPHTYPVDRILGGEEVPHVDGPEDAFFSVQELIRYVREHDIEVEVPGWAGNGMGDAFDLLTPLGTCLVKMKAVIPPPPEPKFVDLKIVAKGMRLCDCVLHGQWGCDTCEDRGVTVSICGCRRQRPNVCLGCYGEGGRASEEDLNLLSSVVFAKREVLFGRPKPTAALLKKCQEDEEFRKRLNKLLQFLEIEWVSQWADAWLKESEKSASCQLQRLLLHKLLEFEEEEWLHEFF